MSSMFPSSTGASGDAECSDLGEYEQEIMNKLKKNNVTSLHLKTSLVYSKALHYMIPIFTRLRELKMDDLLLIDEHISFFVRSLPSLECMETRRMFNIHKPQLLPSPTSSLSSSSIKIVKFINCPRLVGVKNLPPSLELIDLSGSALDSRHFYNLLEDSRATSLKSLIVQRCRKLTCTIDQERQQRDRSIERWLHVRDLPNLIQLDTRYCQNIKHIMITNCPQLREFYVTCCYKVESLVIRGANIKRLDLCMLETLHNLKISDCAYLTYLNLQGCIKLKNIFGSAFANYESSDGCENDDNQTNGGCDSIDAEYGTDATHAHNPCLPGMTEIQCNKLKVVRWIDGSKRKLDCTYSQRR